MPTITQKEAKELGYKKGRYMIQTILINKAISKAHCIQWLKDNGYKYNDYRVAGNNKRFLQTFPIEGAKYFTKKISPQIDFVFQHY